MADPRIRWRARDCLLIGAALLVTAGGSLGAGYVYRRQIGRLLSELKSGRDGPVDATARARSLGHIWHDIQGGKRDDEALRNLRSLPYLQGYERPSGSSGVILHDRTHAWQGANLYVSAHGPEARLMDMDGRLLHRWTAAPLERWGAHAPPPAIKSSANFWMHSSFWRRAHLLPDGGLLVIYEQAGLVRLDRDSKVQWVYWGRCHHDLEVGERGEIYVLAETWRTTPAYNRGRPYLEDWVVVLDAAGKVRRRVSILRCFEDSPYSAHLEFVVPRDDLFHTNTIELLDGRLAPLAPAFARGRVLISIPNLNTVAVLDLEAEQVVWALSGRWRHQHQPSLLDNGRLLLFNNLAAPNHSEVLEIDPLTQQMHWSYRSSEPRFYSQVQGAAYPLPNDNVLVVSSTQGRAFELTRDRRVVWDFRSPHRAGERGQLVASLMDLVRVPENDVRAWLGRADAASAGDLLSDE